ncbi:MAG TPA: carbohydrate porin [Rhizomicrobium sp.]|nr:carbohydrate porin [Rhizomicrobium sp.]
MFSDEKANLVQHGITPTLLYDADIASNLSGGSKRGSTYSGALHFQLLFDGERIVDWPGATLFADLLDIHGGQPSDFAGDAQGVSNIAAPSRFRLYEAWLQYNLEGGRYSILAGRYDLNSEFYRLTSAGLFLNSSFGLGPEFAQSGRAGPSIYPDTSVGVRLSYKPVSSVVIRMAALDSTPADSPGVPPFSVLHGDGVLLVSEFAFLTRAGPAMPPGSRRSLLGRNSSLPPYEDKVAVGGWYYTNAFDDLNEQGMAGMPIRHRGSGGGYILLDRILYGAPDKSGGAVSGFLEAGIGDDRVNRFGSYVGLGVTGRGLIAGRQDDEIGLAAAIGRNGSHFLTAEDRVGLQRERAEATIELAYLLKATDWLGIEPNFQYVVHPNTDPKLGNASVIQVQFEISL